MIKEKKGGTTTNLAVPARQPTPPPAPVRQLVARAASPLRHRQPDPTWHPSPLPQRERDRDPVGHVPLPSVSVQDFPPQAVYICSAARPSPPFPSSLNPSLPWFRWFKL